MTRSQEFITTMLYRLPKWELSTYEHQVTLDKIRERLMMSTDVHEELQRLYTVNNYSQFAMGLLWMMDKVEHDPQKYESTPQEDEFIFSLYKKAIGEGAVPVAQPFSDLLPSPEPPVSSVPPAEPSAPSENSWGDFSSFTQPDQAQPIASDAAEQIQHQSFSSLLDQVLEAIQSGSEDRNALIDHLAAECQKLQDDAATPDDGRSFCQMLSEFLQFVITSQLQDDIRVMNIISNIQGPYAQWEQAPADGRAGLLDGAIDILREVKTMFE